MHEELMLFCEKSQRTRFRNVNIDPFCISPQWSLMLPTTAKKPPTEKLGYQPHGHFTLAPVTNALLHGGF